MSLSENATYCLFCDDWYEFGDPTNNNLLSKTLSFIRLVHTSGSLACYGLYILLWYPGNIMTPLSACHHFDGQKCAQKYGNQWFHDLAIWCLNGGCAHAILF